MKFQIVLLLTILLPLVASAVRLVGQTTRYWDCCKASCAWSEKAPVTHPVQVCEKDGVKVAPAEATNVCAGGGAATGKAYTCTNNQPIAINSSLALGFTSVHITGKGEADWLVQC